MSPTDPLLLLLAERAKVRPAHIWHCLCVMRERKGKFIPASFAMFNKLELHHVQRMVEVIEAEGLGYAVKAKIEPVQKGTRLPDGFTMPTDWHQWAQVQRGWSMDVVKTEAEAFIDYWRGVPGSKGVKLDWLGTWRNWVRRSHTANGNSRANDEGNDFASFCRRQIIHYRKLGDRDSVSLWEKKLESI